MIIFPGKPECENFHRDQDRDDLFDPDRSDPDNNFQSNANSKYFS